LIMKKNKERHVGSFFFIQMGLIAIILENVFYSVGLIDRLTIYFTIFVSIAFPSSIAIGVRGEHRRFIAVLGLAGFVVLYLRAVLTSSNGVFPYTNILLG